AEHRTLVRLRPTADDKANADFLVASYDYKQWDPKGPNSGSNRQSRLAAQSALMQFYQQNRNTAAASRYVVEAAYAVAKMKKTAGERDYRAWLASTVTEWDGFHARSGAEAQKPPYVDYAAEA